MTSVFVCAGDVSADRHTGRLLSKLKTLSPGLEFWGVGGPRMEAEGASLIANCEQFAAVGIIEPLRKLPFFAALRQRLVKEIGERRPAAVLLVDFGGFNIGLAQMLRPKFPDLPIVYFISPQVWGSRPWRIQVLKRCISKMLVIFPFEETIYRSQGLNASFVGHPLTLSIPGKGQTSREQFCQAHGLESTRPIIGIFPGSRRREIKDLMPIILQAMKWLIEERPELQFVISRANPVVAGAIDAVLARAGGCAGLAVLPVGDNANLMAAADILWTKSGTTTLEAALFGKPMLIFYRGDWISYLLVLAYKRVKHVGWPNLLAGEGIVPELIQLDCRAEMLVRYTRDWLDVPAARAEISDRLIEVRGRLGHGDFAENAAREILQAIAAGHDEQKR